MVDLESLSSGELIRIILDQQRVIEQLRAEIEQLKRKGSAAPFSKGTRKTGPKGPGRKKGQGPFHRRGAPAASHPATPVKVTATCCRRCGGELGEASEEIVSTSDIAAQPQPDVRVYAVQVRRCQRCGQAVRGQHPDVAGDQWGATAHRLGARIKSMAHVLHYGHGVPLRKVPVIMEQLAGVRVTQGALTQDALKQVNGPVGRAYEQLRKQVSKSEVVHTDDTGWRVGGDTAFLMAFTNAEISVYQIRQRHRNEEVRELIPADFGGVMVCDRGKSYDAQELRGVAQQKCVAHLIRNAGEVTTQKNGRAKQFSQDLKRFLQDAIGLAAQREKLDPAVYARRAAKLEEKLTHHLRNRLMRDADNQKLLNGVGSQHDQGNVLRFLQQPGIEATNNRAERALRPAVIARKVSHCSKTARGARALEAFLSVVETAKKTCSAAAETLYHLIADPPPISSP